MSVQWIHPGLLMMIGLTSIVVYHYRQDQQTTIQPVLFSLFIAAIVAIILASEWSFPAWHLSETLRIVQRPYRFITVVMLSVIWMVPLALALGLPRHRYLRGTIIIIFLTPFLLFCALQVQIAINGQSPQPRLEQAMQGDFGQPEYFPAGRALENSFGRIILLKAALNRNASIETGLVKSRFGKRTIAGGG